jgi:MASE1
MTECRTDKLIWSMEDVLLSRIKAHLIPPFIDYPQTLNMSRLNFLLLILMSVTYYLLFFINDYLFSFTAYTDHVNWIYLPSGIALGYVLVMEEIGALGIFIASVAINLQLHSTEPFWSDVFTSLISATTPLVARKLCVHWMKVDENLVELTFKKTVECSLVFALISSALHQIWFHFDQLDEIFFEDFLAMFIGDVLGSLLVLLLGSFVIKIYRQYQARKL